MLSQNKHSTQAKAFRPKATFIVSEKMKKFFFRQLSVPHFFSNHLSRKFLSNLVIAVVIVIESLSLNDVLYKEKTLLQFSETFLSFCKTILSKIRILKSCIRTNEFIKMTADLCIFTARKIRTDETWLFLMRKKRTFWGNDFQSCKSATRTTNC